MSEESKATKGSQWLLQKLIAGKAELINGHIGTELAISHKEIQWVSPVKAADFKEYRDEEALYKLGIACPKVDLPDFWPKKGPQWDALGHSKDKYFLLEAKANVPELVSSCQAKNPSSQKLIQKSLKATQDYLEVESYINWQTGFYQYANRLAHLYFLREVNKVDAYLVFLYFLNDTSHIPTTIDEWSGALDLQKKLMGLSKHKLQKYIVNVFINADDVRR